MIAGDPEAIGAAGWTPPDLWEPAGGLVLGPRAGDLAALELCSAPSASGRPAGLPEESAARLEATGMRLPWERAAAAQAFAATEAPVVAPFTTPAIDGSTLDLDAHEGPVVLAFWATWCGPCRQEMPHLQALREAHRAQGLEVWALSTDRAKDREKIPELWERWGVSLPVAPAPAALVQAWDVRSVPRVVVLDAEHRRVLDHQGFSEESFAELEEQVQEVLAGTLKGERSLGLLAGQLDLLATGSLPGRPKALVRGPDGGVQVLARGALVPLTRQGEALQTGAPQRLPLVADQALWADLDGDGPAELLLVDGEAGTLRVSDAEGAARWTRRGAEPIGGLGLLHATGGALLVTLRAGVALEDPPAGSRGIAPGEQVQVPRHHLEVLGPDGALRTDLPLPAPVLAFAPAPDGHAVAVVLADAEVLLLDPDLALRPVEHPLDRPRGLTWDGGDLWVSGGAARSLLVGRGAEGARWRLAETGGGDLWALAEDGAVMARLDLQRPVLSVVGDLEGDGKDEVILWAPWFGLAVVRPEPCPRPPAATDVLGPK
ncbi:MAG: TlpA disulfide reductase family protein [Pseudomonadota bacterium]